MPEQGVEFYPKTYTIDIEIGQNESDTGSDSVSLDNDFILRSIRHELIDDGSGNPPTQDGNYRLGWSIQTTTRFYKGPDPMADAAYGSVRHGEWTELDAPLKIGENRTLEAQVTNTQNRANPFKVQVLFVGLEPQPSANIGKF